MARNGSGVYSLPGTYLAVSGETIEAQQHNDPLEDLEADANNARPIVAGGTGAASAADARTNLGVVAAGTLDAPAGTALLFQQTAAPTGWTKQTTHNNKALRLVSGTASSGGSTAFTTVFASRTISQANLPAVAPTFTGSSGTVNVTSGATDVLRNPAGIQTTNSGTGFGIGSGPSGQGGYQLSSSGSFTPSGTISNLGSGTAMDFAVQYVDIIIATKD